MGAILKVLRQRKTPFSVAGKKRAAPGRGLNGAAQTSLQNRPGAKRSMAPISVEEKCELLEMLRLGKSYKLARRIFRERTGKDVKERSLARWVATAVQGEGVSIPERLADRRKVRSGRGGCVEGGFKKTLVDHLNRNFTTWKHLQPSQCWGHWQLVEIRFWLVFGVLPVRVALLNAEFRNQSLVKVAGDVNWNGWAEWYDQQITTQLAGGDLDSGVKDLLDAVSKAFPSFEPMAHKGNLKFCARSIRDGLGVGGYVESNPRKRLSASPVWVKITSEVQTESAADGNAADGDGTLGSVLPQV